MAVSVAGTSPNFGASHTEIDHALHRGSHAAQISRLPISVVF